MHGVAAVVASVFTLASSIVFTPQKIASDVLGLFDVARRRDTTEAVRVDTVTDVAPEAAGTRVDLDETRRDRRQDRARTAREKATDRAAAKRSDAKARRDALRAEAADRRAAARDAAKTRRAEAKERIAKIRDEKKRKIAERVCTKFESLNARMTAHYTDSLGRLAELVGKIESRATKAAEHGRDTASCNDAIATANSAINAAQDAVNVQAGNTYVCEITDDASLGSSLSSTRQQLKDDLHSMRGQVKQAHSAVTLALRCLSGVRDVDVE